MPEYSSGSIESPMTTSENNEPKGRSLALRRGELVEVRSAQEIFATLDASGAIDALPFMPEMLEYCGKQFRVDSRSDKTCDTINYDGARRMYDTVHLEGMRCNGSAHGGCQAQCPIFWKESWLKRVGEKAQPGATANASRAGSAAAMTPERLAGLTQRPASADQSEAGQSGAAASEPRYRCQATDLLLASQPMRWWDLRQYWRDVWSGNVTVMQVVRAALFRIFLKTIKLGGYRAQLWFYDRLQALRHATPYPYYRGTLEKTPTATLGLAPGEYVRVKSQQDVLRTVNARNRNRGLSFDPEMVRYCGKVHQVRARVERIIDERSGRMTLIPSDCIILEGAVCCAEYSDKRLFCPRKLYPFWREIWLERVSPPADASSPSCSNTSQ